MLLKTLPFYLFNIYSSNFQLRVTSSPRRHLAMFGNICDGQDLGCYWHLAEARYAARHLKMHRRVLPQQIIFWYKIPIEPKLKMGSDVIFPLRFSV